MANEYAAALKRFKAFAYGRFAGAPKEGATLDNPNIRAAEAAAVLRYLKGVEEKLPTPGAPSWRPVGEAIAKIPIGQNLTADVRDDLWRYAGIICGRADADGLAFEAVHPDPPADYAALRSTLGLDAPATSPAEAELEAEWGKPKKPPGPTPGDKFNTGLLLLAVIIIASLGHRAR